jgi:inorganic triphosphatase YgiF
MQSEHEIPLEREATLLICSDRPETVYQEIASLTAIGAYKLVPGNARLLEDHYFDTPDGKLTAKKWGLRLRRIGNDLWITLKGPAKQTEWGGRERAEIEERWSKTSVPEIDAELSRQGMEMDFHGEDLEHSAPMEVMTSAGLVVIQRRNTRRVASAVISGTDGMVQAELAADSVTYFFPETEILHCEVEIESKGPNGPAAAAAIAEYLLAEYSPELKRWHHDKLATGWAIRELLAGGSLEGLLDVNNRLKSSAYDRIDEYLRQDLSK